MKKLKLIASIIGLTNALIVFAGPTAVQEGIAFTANGSTLNVASVTDSGLPEGCAASHDITSGNAIDVVLSDGYAIVTSTDGDNNNTITTFDVSACLSGSESDPVEDSCTEAASVDLNSGKLHIPCLQLNGEYFNVYMDRRGKSSNWEVSGIDESKHSSSHKKDK